MHHCYNAVLSLRAAAKIPLHPLPRRTALYLAGRQTVFDASRQAFLKCPLPNTLARRTRQIFLRVTPPLNRSLSRPLQYSNPGLGPVFSHTSCVGCHLRDGRGRGAFGSEPPFVGSMLMRVSLPGFTPHGGPVPVPGFGVQLGDRANFGVALEARVQVSFYETTETLSDGEEVYLKHPIYTIVDAYQPLPAGVLSPARHGPARIWTAASWKPSRVRYSRPIRFPEMPTETAYRAPQLCVQFPKRGQRELGALWTKSQQPRSLATNPRPAYNEDMGVTNPYFPRESCIRTTPARRPQRRSRNPTGNTGHHHILLTNPRRTRSASVGRPTGIARRSTL